MRLGMIAGYLRLGSSIAEIALLRLAFTFLIPVRGFARVFPFSPGMDGIKPGPRDSHLVGTIGILFQLFAWNVIWPFLYVDGLLCRREE